MLHIEILHDFQDSAQWREVGACKLPKELKSNFGMWSPTTRKYITCLVYVGQLHTWLKSTKRYSWKANARFSSTQSFSEISKGLHSNLSLQDTKNFAISFQDISQVFSEVERKFTTWMKNEIFRLDHFTTLKWSDDRQAVLKLSHSNSICRELSCRLCLCFPLHMHLRKGALGNIQQFVTSF